MIFFLDTINGTWQSALTSSQLSGIDTYCSSNGVKIVKLNDAPDASTGVSMVASAAGPAWGGSGDNQDVTLSPLGVSLAASAGLYVTTSIKYSSAGLYHYNGALTAGSQATPVAYFGSFGTNFPTQTIAAANYTVGNVNILSFYMAFGPTFVTSQDFGKIWLTWVSNGNYPVISQSTFKANGPIPTRALVLSRRM
jgi:hypothetical protein